MKRLLSGIFILILCITCTVACKKLYTITYHLNSGTSNGGNPATYTSGQELVLNDGVREDYSFVGWYLDSEFTDKIERITASTTGDLNLYAKWEHLHPSRTVTSISTAKEGSTMQASFHCNTCDEDFVDTIKPSDIGMPIVNIVGDLTGISKDNRLQVQLSYYSDEQSFDCYSTIKLQGASSVRHNYPKQNYSIQLFKDSEFTKKKKVEFVSGWGEQSKYVLKANWVDFSQSRNIVSAKLYGEVVHSRDLQDEIANLYNGGAIDGYPVLLYQNGYYQGLYSLNIPKDKWLFGMGDGENEAIVMGDGYSNTTKLLSHVSSDFESSKMDLEYCTNEDTDTTWVVDSLNNMIDFINDNDGENFKNGISNYVNLDRTIDDIIFTLVMAGADNYQNNVMYVTYDGIHWQTSVYDMDSTWGMSWDGRFNIEWTNSTVYDPNWSQTTDIMQTNMLFKRIWDNYRTEIRARYNELRQSVLTYENIANKFTAYIGQIPTLLYDTDLSVYTNPDQVIPNPDETIPNPDQNTLSQILTFAQTMLTQLDLYI